MNEGTPHRWEMKCSHCLLEYSGDEFQPQCAECGTPFPSICPDCLCCHCDARPTRYLALTQEGCNGMHACYEARCDCSPKIEYDQKQEHIQLLEVRAGG